MENESVAKPADAVPPTAASYAAQPMGASRPHDHYPLWQAPPYRAPPAWEHPRRPPLARPKPRPFRPLEIGVAVAVPAIADVALWARGGLSPGGFGLALLFTVVPALLFLAARSWRGSVRLGVILALLTLVVLRNVFDPTPGTIFSGLGLVVAFGLALRARRVFVPEALLSAFAAVTKLPSRIGAAAVGARKLTERTRVGNVSVLPIVIPAGLIALFLGIFALANPIVAHGLATAWSAVASVVAFPSVGRMVFWTLALAGGASLLRPACRLATGTETAETAGEATTTSLLVARNALAALNALFLLESALDATYLWSGSPPAGMDTQHYAHEGAFWLTLALLALTAVIGVMFRGPLAHDPRARKIRWLAWAWMGQGLVLAAGTYRRIAIHVGKSGLSDLRIVGILGTTLVVCGVVLVGLKLRERKTFTWLVRRQLDAFALTAVLYAVAPTHLLSAHVNVARVRSGEYRPVLHAFRQSHETESAAAFIPLLEHPDARIREGVAALLADEHERLRAEAERRSSWRERDLATSSTLAALDGASERIATALGTADRVDARRVLLELSRAANQDRSLEELLAIPPATRLQSRSLTDPS